MEAHRVSAREVALAYASNANNLALAINDLDDVPKSANNEIVINVEAEPPPRPANSGATIAIDGFER